MLRLLAKAGSVLGTPWLSALPPSSFTNKNPWVHHDVHHFMVIDWQLIAPSCLDKIDIHHSLIHYSLFDDQTTVAQLFQ